jgi:chromosomal replication initiation ATPase DnaA
MKRTIEFIEKVVCENEYVEAEHLHTSNRSEPYNTTRQMIMVLAVEGGYTFKDAGAYFGRDHSTVTSARRSIYNRIETEKYFANKYSRYKMLCDNTESPSIDFLIYELARLKIETAELIEKLNQIAI